MAIPAAPLEFIEPQRPCSYLPEQTAALEYRGYPGLSPDALEELICRGWRRFGVQVFRPACPACQKCIPVRIDVASFQPTKSQRRTQRRNDHITFELATATVSEQHVDLYNRWHADMADRRDWREQETDPRNYARSFLSGAFPSAHELRYYDSDELVGIGLIDMLPSALSSIYFYHAPEWRPLGPGTFSLLCEIELARRLGLQHVYLGFWIAECPSMAYKNRFHPHEVLLSRPTDEEQPQWLKAHAADPTLDEGGDLAPRTNPGETK
ncbi:arginyltransferase [Planctomicrobium piriforme]|nr:arginyltransferase [Planctomicrobium piriforme]